MLAHAAGDVVDAVLVSPLERRTQYSIVQPALLRTEFDTIRTRGVAFDREEASLGLVCVAAPIRNRRRDTVAAVSVSGPTGRFDPDRYVTAVRHAAMAIGDRLYS